MPNKTGWFLATYVFMMLVLAGCSKEEQAPVYTELREMPSMKESLHTDTRYEPLTPVMQDVYDRSIPEDVYSTD
ncbi:hypothetical protein [Paenibacillus wynnii]|uniref:Uncharacterized protein n=1 Tax=Paenibacillus wynnii TaxID=268407 RepID=A0A098M3Q2_9BACL|nr:hypothetical protein [Paenibacillus wynnii]KGE16656.1 hypothetical protein PWYN_18305 [Paenibacillus wynnii]